MAYSRSTVQLFLTLFPVTLSTMANVSLDSLGTILLSHHRAHVEAYRTRVYEACVQYCIDAARNIGEHNDTGGLRQSVSSVGNITAMADGFRITFSHPTAAFVEYGTRPHFPPIEPIREWVRRKLRPIPTGRRTRATSRSSQAAQAEQSDLEYSIALAICRRIAARGTAPVGYAARARAGLVERLTRR